MKKPLTLRKITVIIIISICSIAIIKQQFSMHRVKKDVQKSQQELEELKEKNAMLEAELESARNQTEEYLERLARERLGMVKPGEQVISIDKSAEDKKSE